jgi:hypothetical protein
LVDQCAVDALLAMLVVVFVAGVSPGVADAGPTPNRTSAALTTIGVTSMIFRILLPLLKFRNRAERLLLLVVPSQ